MWYGPAVAQSFLADLFILSAAYLQQKLRPGFENGTVFPNISLTEISERQVCFFVLYTHTHTFEETWFLGSAH
jgi:hypothetical protein